MTDAAYVAAARKTLRRTLFRRFKRMGLSQDQVTQNIARVEQGALAAMNLADLAAIAASAGQVAAALQTANPADPALASFVSVRDSTGDAIRDLATWIP